MAIGTEEKRIDWHKAKADYITGMSQREIAAKYGVSRTAISKKCVSEHWQKEREKAKAKVTQEVIRKTADAAADNAATAARIKAKLLQKLEREIDALPDLIGTETQDKVTEVEYVKDKNGKLSVRPSKTKEHGKAFRLRDLTAAYKDLTADMQVSAGVDVEDLSPLAELLK